MLKGLFFALTEVSNIGYCHEVSTRGANSNVPGIKNAITHLSKARDNTH